MEIIGCCLPHSETYCYLVCLMSRDCFQYLPSVNLLFMFLGLRPPGTAHEIPLKEFFILFFIFWEGGDVSVFKSLI